MTFEIEIVLRENDHATTERLSHPVGADAWTEQDVREVLMKILSAIDRAKNPGVEREATLRGFSWIVEPSDGEVVIAIEIPMGAAVAGPFGIDGPRLTGMIQRVLAQTQGSSAAIH
jgi:hypothetical protein